MLRVLHSNVVDLRQLRRSWKAANFYTAPRHPEGGVQRVPARVRTPQTRPVGTTPDRALIHRSTYCQEQSRPAPPPHAVRNQEHRLI